MCTLGIKVKYLKDFERLLSRGDSVKSMPTLSMLKHRYKCLAHYAKVLVNWCLSRYYVWKLNMCYKLTQVTGMYRVGPMKVPIGLGIRQRKTHPPQWKMNKTASKSVYQFESYDKWQPHHTTQPTPLFCVGVKDIERFMEE